MHGQQQLNNGKKEKTNRQNVKSKKENKTSNETDTQEFPLCVPRSKSTLNAFDDAKHRMSDQMINIASAKYTILFICKRTTDIRSERLQYTQRTAHSTQHTQECANYIVCSK